MAIVLFIRATACSRLSCPDRAAAATDHNQLRAIGSGVTGTERQRVCTRMHQKVCYNSSEAVLM